MLQSVDKAAKVVASLDLLDWEIEKLLGFGFLRGRSGYLDGTAGAAACGGLSSPEYFGAAQRDVGLKDASGR